MATVSDMQPHPLGSPLGLENAVEVGGRGEGERRAFSRGEPLSPASRLHTLCAAVLPGCWPHGAKRPSEEMTCAERPRSGHSLIKN